MSLAKWFELNLNEIIIGVLTLLIGTAIIFILKKIFQAKRNKKNPINIQDSPNTSVNFNNQTSGDNSTNTQHIDISNKK